MLWLPVLDYMSKDVLGLTSSSSALWRRLVLLESSLQLVQLFSIFVELGLQLSQLRELCGLVVLWKWRVQPSLLPRSLGSPLAAGVVEVAPALPSSLVSLSVAMAPSTILKHSLMGSLLSDLESGSGSTVV